MTTAALNFTFTPNIFYLVAPNINAKQPLARAMHSGCDGQLIRRLKLSLRGNELDRAAERTEGKVMKEFVFSCCCIKSLILFFMSEICTRKVFKLKSTEVQNNS